MSDQITFSLDGEEIKAKNGSNILQAAIDSEKYIPYLCYYPGMKSFGACRMCVVEVEQIGPDGNYRSIPGTPAACTTPVNEGMRVTTKNRNIDSTRKGIMDLLLTEHPHGCLTCHRVELCGPSDVCLRHVSVNDRCVTCPKNERCELKDTVRYLEMDMDSPLTYNNRNIPLHTTDPFWDMDMNLCIACVRCVRVCDEVRGDSAITLLERSGRTLIGTAKGSSLIESGCEFCGACIDVCPTGALVETKYKWDKAVKKISTVCNLCPVGCKLTLEVDKRNRMIRSIPDLNGFSNHGQGCFKGKFGLDFVNSKNRIPNPIIPKLDSTGTTDFSWHEAIDYVANNLTKYIGDEFAFIASSNGSNEDNYLAQKFTRIVMKTNNIDTSTNFKPILSDLTRELTGYVRTKNSIWDIEKSDVILLVSTDLLIDQNLVSLPIKRAVNNGSKLIVIDQRDTNISKDASLFIKVKPNTESVFISGMIRVILDESLDNHDFLYSYVDNVSEFRNSIWTFDVLKVAEITGVSVDIIKNTARIFAKSGLGSILYALETIEDEYLEQCIKSLYNLAIVTGNINNQIGGLYPLNLGSNHQGSIDVGCSPNYLPGYVEFSNKNIIEKNWKTTLPEVRGKSLKDISDEINNGKIKCVYFIGDTSKFPDHFLREFKESLRKLEFFIVEDSFNSDLTEIADVVLPSTTFVEKEGSFTNLEGLVQLARPALGLKNDQEHTWKILSKIAIAMNTEGFDYESSQDIFNEIVETVKSYSGFSYDFISSENCRTHILPENIKDENFVHKFNLSILDMNKVSININNEFPFLLALSNILYDNQNDLKVDNSNGNRQIKRNPTIHINLNDASKYSINNGDLIQVETEKMKISGLASLDYPHEGLIAASLLFGARISEFENDSNEKSMINTTTDSLILAKLTKI